MKRSARWAWVASATAALVTIPAWPGSVTTGAADTTATVSTTPDAATDQITLYAGEVRVLKVHHITRVALGNGKLLSIQRAGDELILIAQAPGVTNMLLWHRDGSVRAYNILVTAQNAREVGANLASALTSVEGLKVASVAGHVVLTGDLTPDDYKRVDKIGQDMSSDVINLTHPDTVDMQRMVYLNVQVVDFKKSALRHIGIDWQNALAGPVLGIVKDWRNNPYYRIGDISQGGNASNQFQGSGGPLTGLPVQMPYAEYFGITSSLSSVIDLAAQNGDAYVLANPQLSTRSGGTASFLAGGQIPIPITSVLGQSSVQYKDYGVHLDIKPVADAHGNVLADINTEVSRIDPSVTINGYPGFLTRKTSSIVNVKSGQTIVLSGLVQSDGSNSISKFPWLGDVPILGELFRDKNFSADRSELVIFVTPEIITPNSAVSREVVQRGTQLIHDFDKQYGDGIQMPGFGIGPGSHPRAARAAGAQAASVGTTVTPAASSTPASGSTSAPPPAVPPASSAAPASSVPAPASTSSVTPASVYPVGDGTQPKTSALMPPKPASGSTMTPSPPVGGASTISHVASTTSGTIHPAGGDIRR